MIDLIDGVYNLVSYVGLDQEISGLTLILFKVISILDVTGEFQLLPKPIFILEIMSLYAFTIADLPKLTHISNHQW